MVARRKKFETRFPVARIKKLIQSDEEIGKLSSLTPFAISKALELFLHDLMKDCFILLDEDEFLGSADGGSERGRDKQDAYEEYPESRIVEDVDEGMDKGDEPSTPSGNMKRRKTSSRSGFRKLTPKVLYLISTLGHPNCPPPSQASLDNPLLSQSIKDGHYWFLKELLEVNMQNSRHSSIHSATSVETGGDIYPISGRKKSIIPEAADTETQGKAPRKPRGPNKKKKAVVELDVDGTVLSTDVSSADMPPVEAPSHIPESMPFIEPLKISLPDISSLPSITAHHVDEEDYDS